MSEPRWVRFADVVRQAETAARTRGRVTHLDARELAGEVFEVIARWVRAGHSVNVPGFGVFYRSTSVGRRIVSPVGGELELGARSRLALRAAAAQKRKGVA